jgi:hypothetical protein
VLKELRLEFYRKRIALFEIRLPMKRLKILQAVKAAHRDRSDMVDVPAMIAFFIAEVVEMYQAGEGVTPPKARI